MRHRTRRKRFVAVALVAAMALFAAACGDDDGGGDDAGDDTEAPEGREDQDPGFDDLRASDDLGVGEDDGGGEETDEPIDEETDEPIDEESDEPTEDEETDGGSEPPSGDDYEDYVQVEDDTGALTFDVPEEFVDVDEAAGSIDGETEGVGVLASTDIADFEATYDVPGIYLSANEFPAGEDPDAFVRSLLDTAAPPDCTFDESADYDDGFYLGEFDVYTDCAGTDTALVFLVAVDPAEEYFVAVLGQVLSQADLAAIDAAVVSSIYLP